MPDKYYQEYGPIHRRRSSGTLHSDKPQYDHEDDVVYEAEPSVRRRIRRAQRRPARRRSRSLFGLLLLVGIIGGALFSLPYATSVLAGDRAMEGVSLTGEPIGGKTLAEIRALLEERYGAFRQSPLTLTFEGRSWTPTLDQLGFTFDFDRVAADTLATGNRGGPLNRLEELWMIWQGGGVDVAPRLTVDMNKLQSYLTDIAKEIDQPPRDAALNIAEGKVLPTPAYQGRQAQIDTTAVDIVLALQKLEPATVVVRTRTLTPTITNEAMEPAIAQAQKFLKEPIEFYLDDQVWTWEPERIGSLISIQTHNGKMEVKLDEERLARAVEQLAQVVDSPSAEPRVAFRDGQPRIVTEGQVGRRVIQDRTVRAISAMMQISQRRLKLPVEELTPQVTAETLPTLGIVELVGEGKSSYVGSAQYRITNIKAGAARMDGVLIAPGEEFSFNRQLGEVDEANGFVQGYAVIGNSTQLEWGGGVCQDSTTVFRAAFWAGLPITERHAHPFYISWYDPYSFPDASAPGMDASIYTGVSDLKFVNDTGHWLLMEATTDDVNQVMTVRLYGTKPNRTVRVLGPEITNRVPPPSSPVYLTDSSLPAGTVKQTDTARAGMDIYVTRIITENGQEREPEVFFTRFKAWPDVFVRGTGN
jgi:vancomycin resistance protein YoaR